MALLIDSPNPEAILANLPIPLLVVDKEGRILSANDATESFLRQSQRALRTKSLSEVLTFASRRLNAALLNWGEDISAQDMELHLPHGDTQVDITISGLSGDIEGHRLILLIPRNTDRSHINDGSSGQQQAMGAPAILGHEIKNPLAGIRGAAQLIANSGTETQRGLTDLIVNEVDRIARLLDQMQHLGGSREVTTSAENIHLIIEKAIRSIRAANRDIPNLTINYDPSLPDVLIDSDGMVQILINLIQNAIDALVDTDNAAIGISTRFVMSGALREAIEDDASGRALKLPVEVSISDNGPGVPQHIEKELFAPFVTTKRTGQGLGLAIVRKLIQQMHSRIVFDRDETQGITYFKLYLPVAKGV